jgi:hypothetical protein
MFPVLVSLIIAPLALASAERSLPRGEEHPAVITKVYASPFGEVQFLEINGGSSAMLRDAKGDLGGLHEVQGSSKCDEWFVSDKESSIPAGCSFVFYNELEGKYLRVNSDEMSETNLFQMMSGALRGQVKNVSL